MAWCESESNERSPADDINHLSAVWTRFNGSLYSTNKYRGPPSQELDAEWDRFTDYGKFSTLAPSSCDKKLIDAK